MKDKKSPKIVYEVYVPDLKELVKNAVLEALEESQKENDPFSKYPEYCTTSQAVKILNCSKSYFYKLTKSKAIEKVYLPGSKYPRYSKRELIEKIEELRW